MEPEYPFSEREVGEIKNIARYSLNGYKLSRLSKSEMIYKTAFDSFKVVASVENADVFQLPYSGGVLEQPYKTMRMWQIFKNELGSHIAKENKKKAQQAKSKRR